jgi:large subunit ribosomal protein L20
MARTSRSVAKRARHKKWIQRAKGFRGRRKNVYKIAKEAVIKAGQYAYRDRRRKKTVRRQLWHIHINAVTRPAGLPYSRFMHALRQQHISLDRKVLAQLATQHPEILTKLAANLKK